MAKTAYLTREEFLLHDTGPGHPERPHRIEVINDAVAQSGLDLVRLDCRPANRKDLLRVHTSEHIDSIERTCRENTTYPDPDTVMGPASWEAALLAAGAGISAAKAVLEDEVDNAFCAVRPPGHHAEAHRAMGFCLFNNVAIAARWLLDEAGLGKVAIIDWDVHHGNGTQRMFYDDDTVFYASIHQAPHYPGTGAAGEQGKGNTTLNCPMRQGAGSIAWRDALEDRIVRAIEAFAPEFLLLSAGFDAHRSDPLAGQQLDADDYTAMTRAVLSLAGGRVVSVLEGGYDLDALGQCAVAHLRALTEA